MSTRATRGKAAAVEDAMPSVAEEVTILMAGVKRARTSSAPVSAAKRNYKVSLPAPLAHPQVLQQLGSGEFSVGCPHSQSRGDPLALIPKRPHEALRGCGHFKRRLFLHAALQMTG